MKKIILATLAAASLVACAKEDIVASTNGEAIAFNNAFVDNTTKAIDPSTTKANLVGFQVYGTTKGDHAGAETINIFNDLAVGHNLTDGVGPEGWKYATSFTQYWIADNTYNFAAVANAADDAVATSNEPETIGMPASITYDATTQKDLLYASYNNVVGKVSGNDPIAFTFSHLLSKVKFTFQNESAAGTDPDYTYKVTDITISAIGKEAVCDVSAYTNTNTVYTWGTPTELYPVDAPLAFGHIVATAEDAENAAAINVGPASSGVSNWERLVIPGTYNAVIKCRIALLIGTKEADVIDYNQTITGLTFNGGNSYNFVLKSKVGEPIQFTVQEVNGWGSDVPVNTPEQ